MKPKIERRKKDNRPTIFPHPKSASAMWVIEWAVRGGWRPYYGGFSQKDRAEALLMLRQINPERKMRLVYYKRSTQCEQKKRGSGQLSTSLGEK